MTPADLFWAFVWAGVLLLCGSVLAARVGVLQRLFLPGSIIGGLLALLAGPQGFAALLGRPHELISETTYAAWRGLPGLLINVVFASLFLGKSLPGIRDIWRKCGAQVAFGQTLAWGQYVVGLTLAIVILTPVFGLPPMAGALIEIAFEGGHGTSAGMAASFRELGFPDGADLALGLATVGLVAGILCGTAMIHWAVRRKHLRTPMIRPGDARPAPAPSGPSAATELAGTDPLAVHFGIVGLAIGFGWLMRQALLRMEAATWGGGDFDIVPHVPLFPLAMLGGLLVQWLAERAGVQARINRRMMRRIAGTALDFTIVAALGTLSLRVIGRHWMPFTLLALGGLLWSVLCTLWLAPRVFSDHWFERAIGDFGQSTGVTVTGLLLMRMADPRNESGAYEGFGYKQLLFEPVVGGGLFTAASLPLIVRFGPVPILVLTSALTIGWMAFGLLLFGPRRTARTRPSG